MTMLKFTGPPEGDGLACNIKISLTKAGRERLRLATGGKNILGESDTLVVFGHPDRVVSSKRNIRVLAAMDHDLRDMINTALITQKIVCEDRPENSVLPTRVETFFDNTCDEEGAWERLLLGNVAAANPARVRVPGSDASCSGGGGPSGGSGTKRGPVATDDLRTVVVLTDDDEDMPDIITDAVAVAAAAPAAAPAAKPPMTHAFRVSMRAKLLELIEIVDNIGSQTHKAGVMEGTRGVIRIAKDIQDSFA
jgi:hypothetical protein